VTTAATGDQVDPSTVGDDLQEAVIVNETANLVTVKTLLNLPDRSHQQRRWKRDWRFPN